jgi:hypothetical protein
MHKYPFLHCLTLAAFLSAPCLAAPDDTPITKLPVREITVFKDGHTFLMREGTVPTDSAGNVTLDELPNPVLGTFWPYSRDTHAKLTAVVAGNQAVKTARTATSIREMLDANPDASVEITDTNKATFDAVVIGVPSARRPATKIMTPNDDSENIAAPQEQPPPVVLLKLPTGATMALPLDQIQKVVFKGDFHPDVSSDDEQRRMTMRLNWPGGREDTAQVGMVYLEKGIRWQPSYKIDLDGKGHAHVQLEATLVNDTIDLNDVTTNLVIGVPTFSMAGNFDPISLQETIVRVAAAMAPPPVPMASFSNSVSFQQQYASNDEPEQAPPAPAVAGAGANEDLFVFKVAHITLKKGERMVVPISSYDLPYTDVYTLDLPASPPLEVRQYLNSYSGYSSAPKMVDASPFMHKIRLVNRNSAPLTTAPALVLRNGQIIAQGLMSYAAIGATTDLPLTKAVNVKVYKNSRETKRTPSAAKWAGATYSRVDISSMVTVKNYEDQEINLEVTRQVLGMLDAASAPGKFSQLSTLDNEDTPAIGASQWWNHFNGVGKVSWKVKMTPKQSLDLKYGWHYFVR